MELAELLAELIGKIRKPNPTETLSAQKTIPIEQIWEDGIVRSVGAVYSKTVAFSDVNYTLLSVEQRQKILDSWGNLLNYFDTSVHLQISYFNGYGEKETDIWFPETDNPAANEFRDFLSTQQNESHEKQDFSRFLTFSVKEKNVKAARSRLKQAENAVTELLGERNLDADPTPLDATARLRLLYRLFHTAIPPYLSWDDFRISGVTAADYLAPSYFLFDNGQSFRWERQYCAAFCFRIQATMLGDGTLMQLLSVCRDSVLTFHIDGINRDTAIRKIKRKQTDVNQSKIEEQKKAVRGGYDMDIIPTDLNSYTAGLEQLLKSVRNGNQHAFYVAMTAVLSATTAAELKNKISDMESIAKQRDFSFVRLDYGQEEGMVSALPLGVNRLSCKRMMTTSALAGFIPFSAKEMRHNSSEALYCGTDALTGNLIMIDRKRGNNPNGMIFGKPGAGKSFAAKTEIFHAFYATDDDILICDPESEYRGIAAALGGQTVRIAQNSRAFLNPMDVNLDAEEEPLKLKSDFLLSLCELILGGRDGLRPIEKSAIDRCIPRIYAKYTAHPIPENMPVLEDLYQELLRQKTSEARYIADSMEMYVKNGSLNVFNHRTNVNIHSRVVVFDIKDLGKQAKPLGMLIVQDAVWNRVSRNRRMKKYTRYYIDEIHLLLREEQTAAYMVEIWKRFRKWGGIPTGITQNVTDLLSSREIENIFGNSDYLLMLSQSDSDREILCNRLHISEAQADYFTDCPAGEGLLKFGNILLPFRNHFPKDSAMYRFMTTRLTETEGGK